jgi:hypothetical protein
VVVVDDGIYIIHDDGSEVDLKYRSGCLFMKAVGHMYIFVQI